MARLLTGEVPVVIVGVWHSAQPTAALVNTALPLAIDAAGTVPKDATGAGGARKRMKLENEITSEKLSFTGPGAKLT